MFDLPLYTRLSRFILVCIAGALLASCDAGSSADADGPYSFQGQTITLVIGLDASAGGTTVGRLLAKHLQQTLEGNPTVIVNNMPGASGLNAHLHVLLKAPRDGTTVYYGPRSSLGELLQLPGFSFKYTDFIPLGGLQLSGLVVFARTDSYSTGINRAEDVVNSEALLFGGMPPEHGRMIISTMGLELLGANYRYIPGYPSSGNIRAAIISGEVNTGTDATHAYLQQVAPVLVDTGVALPIFALPVIDESGNFVANSSLPDVPSLPDLYESIHGAPPSGIVWDAIKVMLEVDQTMQHVFLGPPRMDPAAVDAFRAGVQAAMATEAFRTEAEQVLGYLPEHVSHERQTRILGATSSVTPDVLNYIKSNIEKNTTN